MLCVQNNHEHVEKYILSASYHTLILDESTDILVNGISLYIKFLSSKTKSYRTMFCWNHAAINMR
jgi:hypothetical protein